MSQAATPLQSFARVYGRPASWLVRAPGRVNLIGEHTDYNEGFVLPMAIGRDVVIAGAPNDDGVIRLRSTAITEASLVDLSKPVCAEPGARWTNYPRGVAAGFLERGLRLGGIDLLVDATVLPGQGLSSSAALAVAMVTLLETATDQLLEPIEKVLLCQQAEHRFAGVPCGIMDPFVSVFARKDHLVLLDCRTHRARYIPFTDPAISVLIIGTDVRHELAGSEYPLRRAQCEAAARGLGVSSLRDVTTEQLQAAGERLTPVTSKRARHVVSENARTLKTAEALAEGRWTEVGELMYASHESLRTDFEVSCPELDAVVEIATRIGLSGGVFGCRMTGGGFGGCAVALIQTDATECIERQMTEAYSRRFGITPTVFTSRPAAGASVLRA